MARISSLVEKQILVAVYNRIVSFAFQNYTSIVIAFESTAFKDSNLLINRFKWFIQLDPLNAKTAFRRFPRTKPDVPSQGLITGVTLRENSKSVNPIPLIYQINL